MGSAPSLTRRAALALVLVAGFYALALAVVVAGIWVVAFTQDHFGPLAGWASLIAVAGIFVIVSDLIPRPRRFVIPGPRLTPGSQPRLFEEIRAVAAATGQRIPSEVYLSGEPNAGVGRVGGIAGLGARSYMVIGLPLIAALSISELRGVIAHEFGHHAGGETRLAPIVYRTRERILTTTLLLRGSGWRLMHIPFLWYGRMYIRMTQAVSRKQELDADALAARVAGARPVATGLVKIDAAAYAMPGFGSWLGMVVSAGFRPPVAEGFARYMDGSGVAARTRAVIDAGSTTDPFDSHPSLHERLEALGEARHEPPPVPDAPAIGVLDDETALEIGLLSRAWKRDLRSLPPIGWEATLPLRLRAWKERCVVERAALVGLRPGSLPGVAADIERFVERMQKAGGARQREAAFLQRVGEALALALVRHGWKIEAGLGDIVTTRLDPVEIRPFTVLPELRSGALSAEAWERTCTGTGIADLDLADLGVSDRARPGPGPNG